MSSTPNFFDATSFMAYIAYYIIKTKHLFYSPEHVDEYVDNKQLYEVIL